MLKIPVRISAVLTSLLALVCFAGTYKGLRALSGIADPLLRRDARGFALFWAFLGCVFLAIAAITWRAVPKDEE